MKQKIQNNRKNLQNNQKMQKNNKNKYQKFNKQKVLWNRFKENDSKGKKKNLKDINML